MSISIYIYHISYTYHIHITLVVPSRQCLFTYWNHQQCCWFLYVETCNFGETNPQYRRSKHPKHTFTCSPVTLLTYWAQQLRRHQGMLCENPEHLIAFGHEGPSGRQLIPCQLNWLADSPNLGSHMASFAHNSTLISGPQIGKNFCQWHNSIAVGSCAIFLCDCC